MRCSSASAAARLTPPDLVRRLQVDATDPDEADAAAFRWAHMGRSNLSVGALLTTINEAAGLHPPRTGHVGNWTDILAGRGGAMDLNQSACLHGSAHALLYPFNKTEDATLSAGDWAYAPGSLVTRGRRRPLPLYTWDRGRLIARDHSTPLFVPFVVSALDGDVLPLVDLHRKRLAQHAGVTLRMETELLADREDLVRRMLMTLVEAAGASANPRRAFADLIDTDVALDGQVRRSGVRMQSDGYWLGDERFPDAQALVDAMVVPLRAAADPQAFHEAPPEHAGRFPVLSGHAMGVLSAALSSHYPDGVTDRATMTQPFNPHLHWGARAMAGFPPHEPGYFARRSTRRALTWMCDALVAGHDEIDPVFVILLPAAIFLLCPPDAYPDDATALATLFDSVRSAASATTEDEPARRAVDAAVARWLAGDGRALSAYFLQRLAPRSGVVHGFDALDGAKPVQPDGFLDLTVREACMAVGSLSAILAPRPDAENTS